MILKRPCPVPRRHSPRPGGHGGAGHGPRARPRLGLLGRLVSHRGGLHRRSRSSYPLWDDGVGTLESSRRLPARSELPQSRTTPPGDTIASSPSVHPTPPLSAGTASLPIEGLMAPRWPPPRVRPLAGCRCPRRPSPPEIGRGLAPHSGVENRFPSPQSIAPSWIGRSGIPRHDSPASLSG